MKKKNNLFLFFILAYLLSKSISKEDLTYFSDKIVNKIQDIFNSFDETYDKLNQHFNYVDFSLDEDTKTEKEKEVESKINNFIAKMDEENIKKLPFEIFEAINKKG